MPHALTRSVKNCKQLCQMLLPQIHLPIQSNQKRSKMMTLNQAKFYPRILQNGPRIPFVSLTLSSQPRQEILNKRTPHSNRLPLELHCSAESGYSQGVPKRVLCRREVPSFQSLDSTTSGTHTSTANEDTCWPACCEAKQEAKAEESEK